MPKKILVPRDSAPPLAPYSPGTLADNIVYVAGTLAMDKDGKTVGVGNAGAQTRHILESIRSVLAEAGGTMADVTMANIFLKTFDDYAAMNTVYREFFPTEHPARWCVAATLVKPEFLVEIAVTAHVRR
ncbi:MAG: pyrimidine utilization protein C [Alphaproteobacteria bacterium]|nr:pyrimidine utilization protein C [Alphaproteobacteria bacterium]